MAHGLPSLPRPGAPAQAQVIDFGGLNYGPAGGAGELADCRNLSAREYPCLSQRPGRKNVDGYDDCTAVYDYFGKLIVCAGGKLYLDGKEICEVSDEPKQFAVVNTQLVIWPDGIVVSLTEERVLQDCEPVVTAKDVSTVYDGSSITAPVYIPLKDGREQTFGVTATLKPTVYVYGTDAEKVKACWKAADGVWEGLEALATLKEVTELWGNEIFIPASNYNMVTGNDWSKTDPDTNAYNTAGWFGVVTKNNGVTPDRVITFDVCKVGQENARFYEHFAVGDRVDVFGGDYGLVGTEHAEIGEIDVTANKLTFSGAEVIRQPVLFCRERLGRVRAGEKVHLFNTYTQNNILQKQYMEVSLKEEIPAGCIAFGVKDESEGITNPSTTVYDKPILWAVRKVRFWHPEKKEVSEPYEVKHIDESQMPENYLTMELYPKTYALTITRSLPKLDYICASDNRLWGVSNADKTIWGSELGKPFSFYTEAGLSTGSYAVAVGSDGEFTGCCEIADNVAFFKEDRIHLLVGKEPKDYALYDYQYRGVAQGSHSSMTVINEQLFYLGTDGVYVFSASGSPQLISAAFGQRRFQNAVGGTDGRNYYISMQDSRTGDWGIWVFDAATGRWMQEDETQVLGFTNVSDKLYMVTADGELQIMHEEDSDEKVEWSATFCRIDETIHNRKCYSGLLLRYEADEGSSIKVEVKCDGGPWREVKNVRAESHRTSILPIRPNRCDSFQLRISGEGPVRLRSLVRKVTTGGLL